MINRQSKKFIINFLLIIWICYFLSFVFPLLQFGLQPRTLSGLPGIIFAPFLHGSFSHVLGNSITFSIFAIIMAILEGKKMRLKVYMMIIISGSLLWVFGRNAIHVGASSLIFSLFGYLLLAGWYSGKIKYILASLFLIFFYSSMIFGILPGNPTISWEGHLFGFLTGIFVAGWFHNK